MSASTKRRTKSVKEQSHATDWGVFAVLIACMAFLLNQTAQLAGFNLSFADPFLILVAFCFLVTNRLYVPRYAMLFFAILLVVSTLTTLVITPWQFDVLLSTRSVVGDVIKLFISFAYFVLGVSITRAGLHNVALRWFSIGALCVAVLGVLLEAAGLREALPMFYFGEIRFKGFMSDPNFYAVLACTGVVYFAYSTHFRPLIRWFAVIMLSISVFISGSKTGLVTLVVIATLVILTRTLRSGKIAPAVFLVFAALALVALFNPLVDALVQLANRYSDTIPQLERIASLLSEDPLESISGSGSERASVWATGLHIIALTPIVGVGVGSYLTVGEELFGEEQVAHNTFIQLGAEWGLVLSFVLFAWIAVMLVIATFSSGNKELDTNMLILRETIIVFLIGSMALSLNNARMLWLFLGILAYLCHLKVQQDRKKKLARGHDT